MRPSYEARRRSRIARIRQLRRAGVVISDHAGAYTSWCSNANAVAAVREETPSLRQMFCTWRATVCWLTTSACGDLPVRLPRRDQAEHLELARAQPVRVRVRGSAGDQLVHSREVRSRAQLLEDGARRVQLQRRGVVVAERAARQAEEHVDAGRFVGGVELLPELSRVTQRRERGACVVLGEVDCAADLRGDRAQHRALAGLRQSRRARARPHAPPPRPPTPA